jgi:3-oxoacyl-[acyl-carrier protein] reductase
VKGLDMNGQVAIVTGGAGGLGSAIARRLVDEGVEVVLADVNAAAAEAQAAQWEGAYGVEVDVASADSAQRMADEVLARSGRIDVLVNNAGIAGPTAPVVDYPPDAWRRVMQVNLDGVFHCTRACLPAMLRRGSGRVVNVSSIAGKDGNPDMSAYSASKAGIIAFTKSVAKEVAGSGVLVNCVVPAVIDAGLATKATEGERELFRSRIPLGRMGRPEELAELVAWVASPRCSFSTGAAFDLSGGRAVY